MLLFFMGNIFKGLHTVCVYGKEYFCLSYCHTVTAATPRYTRNRKGTNVGEMFAYLLLLTGLPVSYTHLTLPTTPYV